MKQTEASSGNSSQSVSQQTDQDSVWYVSPGTQRSYSIPRLRKLGAYLLTSASQLAGKLFPMSYTWGHIPPCLRSYTTSPIP